MHELPITESILNIALKHAEADGAERIVRINLRIGELSDIIDAWVQRYFDYLSKDTIADGATLKIERLPVIFRCNACENNFQIDIRKIKDIVCPACGGNGVELVSGREFYIKDIEVL
jgi:hydrogenase nickel incorporation protein HypA/HybF